jgi:hypothetical protein
VVDLAHQGVAIIAYLGDREFAPPAVVSQRQHLYCLPDGVPVFLPQQAGPNMIVPVAEHVRLHGHQVVDDALNGKESTIDLWLYVFDDYPLSSLVRLRH